MAWLRPNRLGNWAGLGGEPLRGRGTRGKGLSPGVHTQPLTIMFWISQPPPAFRRSGMSTSLRQTLSQSLSLHVVFVFHLSLGRFVCQARFLSFSFQLDQLLNSIVSFDLLSLLSIARSPTVHTTSPYFATASVLFGLTPTYSLLPTSYRPT